METESRSSGSRDALTWDHSTSRFQVLLSRMLVGSAVKGRSLVMEVGQAGDSG